MHIGEFPRTDGQLHRNYIPAKVLGVSMLELEKEMPFWQALKINSINTVRRAGVKKIRELLQDKVTINGNVHTVETLIRGSTLNVRKEVSEIKEAFNGSSRIIIGTGDQVGRETPEVYWQ